MLQFFYCGFPTFHGLSFSIRDAFSIITQGLLRHMADPRLLWADCTTVWTYHRLFPAMDSTESWKPSLQHSEWVGALLPTMENAASGIQRTSKLYASFLLLGRARCNNLPFTFKGMFFYASATCALKASPMWKDHYCTHLLAVAGSFFIGTMATIPSMGFRPEKWLRFGSLVKGYTFHWHNWPHLFAHPLLITFDFKYLVMFLLVAHLSYTCE